MTVKLNDEMLNKLTNLIELVFVDIFDDVIMNQIFDTFISRQSPS